MIVLDKNESSQSPQVHYGCIIRDRSGKGIY